MAIKKDEYVVFNIQEVENLTPELYKKITNKEITEDDEVPAQDIYGFVKFFGPSSKIVYIDEAHQVMNGTSAYVECEVTGHMLRLNPESLQFVMTSRS
jgi:hypothetical protein